MLVVTTFRLAHVGPAGAPPPRAPPPPPPRPPPNPPPRPVSQVAAEYPCGDRSLDGGWAAPKWRSRVCLPASMSNFSVLSSAHVMFSRPGTRRLPPAAYTRHGSPLTGRVAAGSAPPPPGKTPRPPRPVPDG